MLDQLGLNTLLKDSTFAGSQFFGGVIGNWVASTGEWLLGRANHGLQRLLNEDLNVLVENHHLIRASWVAQCLAMEAVCARCLKQRFGQTASLLDVEAFSGELMERFTDPSVRSVLWWLTQFRGEARRAEALPVEELEKQFRFSLQDIPLLVRAGAEIASLPHVEDLKLRVTEAWLKSLETYQEQVLKEQKLSQLDHLLNYLGHTTSRLLPMARELRESIEAEWFNILRVVFREVLKSDQFSKARCAFELDVLAKLADDDRPSPSLEILEARLEKQDAEWGQRWQAIKAWNDKVDLKVNQILQINLRVEKRMKAFHQDHRQSFRALDARVSSLPGDIEHILRRVIQETLVGIVLPGESLREPPRLETTPTDLHRYLDAVISKHSRILLPAFGSGIGKMEVVLETMFVGLRGDLATRPQRVLAAQEAENLLDQDDFHDLDEAAYLASTKSARESRSYWDQGAVVLNFAQAIQAVEANDFRMVILGDPGSGKTTLAKWIALKMARALREEQAQLTILRSEVYPEVQADDDCPMVIGKSYLPVFVRISEYAQILMGRTELDSSSTILGHIRQQVLETFSGAARLQASSSFDRFEETGRLLVILDGLDELPDTLLAHHDPDKPKWKQQIRRTVLAQIRELAEAMRPRLTSRGGSQGRNALIVTSRIKGYDFNGLLPGEIMHLTIEPMSLGERKSFFSHWTSAVFERLRQMRKSTEETPARFQEVLVDEVTSDRRLNREVSTPQMAGLIASVALDSWTQAPNEAVEGGSSAARQHLLPRSRTEIYGRAVDILLAHWSGERTWAPGSTDAALAALMGESSQLLRVLKEVAFAIHQRAELQSGDVEEARLAELALQAGEKLRIPWQNACGSGELFGKFLVRLLSQDSGFLMQRAAGVYAFQHRSIQEYLAGRLLSEGNSRDGGLYPDDPKLRELMLNPRQLIHWREVLLHGLAHLQFRSKEKLRQLSADCLATERGERRPFPITLLLLLEVSQALPVIHEPSLTALLVHHMALAFSENPSIREPLWPCFRAALLSLPPRLVIAGFEQKVTGTPAPGLPASIAEMLIRLGAVRRMTGWISPAIISELIHARDRDAEDLRWPVVRCLALVMTAFATEDHPAARVAEITQDQGREYLAQRLLLGSNLDFARSMLVMTGCIDYRDSCYLREYAGFARFLNWESNARDEWIPFLRDYWGTDDQIYSIAVHLDQDFKRSSESAQIVPSIHHQFALSLNPRIAGHLDACVPQAGRTVWGYVKWVWQRFRHLKMSESLLANIANAGPNMLWLSSQQHNDQLITLVRQRREILTDAVYRGVPLMLTLLARTGSQTGEGGGSAPQLNPCWRLAVKAMIGALAEADVHSFHIKQLCLSLSSDEADGVVLAEWWVWLLNALTHTDYVYEGAVILDASKWMLERAQSWRCAAIELTSAGAWQHDMGLNYARLEGFYSSQSHLYASDDVPFHALSNLARINQDSWALTRAVLNEIFEKLWEHLPHLWYELQAILSFLGPDEEDSKSCLTDWTLPFLLNDVLQEAPKIETPYFRCRFLIRVLPVARHADVPRLARLIEEAYQLIARSDLRLLVVDAWCVASLARGLQMGEGLTPPGHLLSLWRNALDEESDLQAKALGLVRIALHGESPERHQYLLEAIACAARIEDRSVRGEVLRELHSVAGLSSELWKAFQEAVKPLQGTYWRSWALHRNSGPLFWLENKMLPEDPAFAAFCAVHATTLLGEALEVMSAEHGPNAINLWHRCLRGEAPLQQLVSMGRLSSFDLTVAVAVALDQLILRGHSEAALRLLPLCVNPSPQVISIASSWAANRDVIVSAYGKLIRAEILGFVPLCDLSSWIRVMHSSDDRTRQRAIQCIRHPLGYTKRRRQRLSKLGSAYMLAWRKLLEYCRQHLPSLASDVSWFGMDLVCDDPAVLGELLDLARTGPASDRDLIFEVLNGLECFEAGSWNFLMEQFAVEDCPKLQACLLTIVIRVAYRQFWSEDRFRQFAAIYQRPGLAGLRSRSILAATPLRYITLFQDHLAGGGSALESTAEFAGQVEQASRFSLSSLDAEDHAAFLTHCRTIADSRFYMRTEFLAILASQVQTNHAVAGVEFFLRWYCETQPDKKCYSGLDGDMDDNLLIVTAAFALKVPTLLRGNISTPDRLEERLFHELEKAPSWAIRASAMVLLGECTSASPRLLQALCSAAGETGAVRMAAFDVATRIRGIDAPFIQLVMARLTDPSGVVAYLMGSILKYAYLQDDMSAALRDEIISALTRARDSEVSRRTVYFDHQPRINLPQLPRLDEHFSKILGEIWLGDQAATLQQSNSGWALKSEIPQNNPKL